jgi:hypothetical protein
MDGNSNIIIFNSDGKDGVPPCNGFGNLLCNRKIQRLRLQVHKRDTHLIRNRQIQFSFIDNTFQGEDLFQAVAADAIVE